MTVGKRQMNGNGNGKRERASVNGKTGDRLTYNVKPKTETKTIDRRAPDGMEQERRTMTGRPLPARDNDENGNE